jgi:hypothetical protein
VGSDGEDKSHRNEKALKDQGFRGVIMAERASSGQNIYPIDI